MVESAENSENYIRRVTIVSAKSMIWASFTAFLINGAWFFFDDFFKTLLQEIVIISATVISIINLNLTRRGRLLTAIRLYIIYGWVFGVFVLWSAGDLFAHTGSFILALSSMMAIFSLKRKESIRWCVINLLGGAAGIVIRKLLNIWGFEEDWYKLLQMFAFNTLIMGTLVFFSYNLSRMLKSTLKNTLKQKEEISSIAKELSEKNVELYQQSITDKLTGLNNRLRLDEVLAGEIDRAARYSSPFSIIIFDIDFFKRVNDTFGHQVGDEALKKISSLVKNNIRSSDIAGRWGGEEFMIICPGTDSDACYILAEKIRAVIQNDRIKGQTVTASFGTAEYRKGDSSQSIVRRADDALYSAKDSGRNRTVSS